MPDDLKIRVSAPGSQKTREDLRGVAKAEERVGKAGDKAARKGERGFRRFGGAIASLTSGVKGLLTGLLGLAGARMVLAALRAETEKMDRAARKAAESMRAILALSSLKGERKEVQESVWKMATDSGRPIEQVAPAYYTLLGGTAGMADDRRQGLMRQALLMAKTDPKANLNSLVGLFSTIGTQQPGMSPRQIGNIVSHTIEQAKSTPEEMAAYLPSILTTARVGKVDPATAMAMFSFGTRRGGGVAESGTAIRAAMLGLMAPSPEVAGQLGQYGFPAGGDLMSKIGWLGSRGGKLPPELVAQLGGRRGLEAISGIAESPRAFSAEVAAMRRAGAGSGSLMQAKLADMYGEVPGQRMYDQLMQAEVGIQRHDAGAGVAGQAERKIVDLYRKRSGENAFVRAFGGGVEAIGRSFKSDNRLPRSWLSYSERALLDLTDAGYPVDEAIQAVMNAEEAGWKGKGSRIGAAALGDIQQSGVQPMQVYQGGTHIHQNDRRDPAGKPRPPVGVRQ